MKRIFALALCLTVLFTGCSQYQNPYVPTGGGLSQGPTQTPGATLPQEQFDAALAYDPDAGFNPYNCMNSTNRALFSLLYQGLFAVDSRYNVTPILCKTYNVSADLKTYTFTLESATFADGTHITAADAVASLKAAQSGKWYGTRLQHVKSVEAYGDKVVVELSSPVENLPLLLDIPIVKAAQVADATPIGSGPYRVMGETLRRQAGWWCTAQLPMEADSIALVEATSSTQLRDSFEIQGVGMVRLDPARSDFVDFHNDYELWACENGLMLYLGFNMDSEIFKKETIRAELTHAIDREKLISNYYRGFAKSAQLPCSPQSPLYNATLASNYGLAPQRLKDALEKEGLVGTELRFLVNGDDSIRMKVAEAIEVMLEDCGFAVTIVETTTKDFATELNKNRWDRVYDLYLAQTRLSTNMDLSPFFGTDTALNFGGLGNPGLYALSLQALENSGNFYTLYEMVMDDGYFCPILFQSDAIYTQRGQFTGFSPARDNLFYYDLGRSLADAQE